jgi:hypothetical protein
MNFAVRRGGLPVAARCLPAGRMLVADCSNSTAIAAFLFPARNQAGCCLADAQRDFRAFSEVPVRNANTSKAIASIFVASKTLEVLT